MVARLKVKKNAPGLRYFSAEELSALSGSFTVDLDPGDEIVHFGQNPPSNVRKRWQEQDVNGSPVGPVKTYDGTNWV
jgi:hypothetical protein